MLSESNNVIAENLARQVAIATGRPASFSGAAAAVTAVLRRLGVAGVIQLVDGSGLSPRDRIAPAPLVQLIRLAAAARSRGLRAGHHRPAGGGVLRHAGPGRQRLRRRRARPALGVVRAKTGNLRRWRRWPGSRTPGTVSCSRSRSWPTG